MSAMIFTETELNSIRRQHDAMVARAMTEFGTGASDFRQSAPSPVAAAPRTLRTFDSSMRELDRMVSDKAA